MTDVSSISGLISRQWSPCRFRLEVFLQMRGG